MDECDKIANFNSNNDVNPDELKEKITSNIKDNEDNLSDDTNNLNQGGQSYLE